MEHRLYHLLTCFQYFLDSLQTPSKVFETSRLAETGFETLWTCLLAAISQDWTGNLLRDLEFDLVWILAFVSVLLNFLKPSEMIIVSVKIRSPDLIGTLSWLSVYY